MSGGGIKAGRTLAMGQDEAVGGGRQSVEAPFGRALAGLGQSRPDIVGLTADLGKYTDILPFRDAFPERFFNVGMAEQNLIAVAAGLARTGKIPFATTYGVFATRRAYDFIAIAVAHSRINVKIIAGLPGLTTGYGGTHQAIEDLALMRMVPGLVVIDPCDATDIATYRFASGKATRLRDGKDVGIVATGLMTERALDAAALLARRGIEAAVLHVPTLKPFDVKAVAEFAASVDRLVAAENHVKVGGLASLVAEALFERGIAKPLTRIGLPDQYIECGSVPHLQSLYGLSTDRVVETVAGLA
jgi:transketolase